MPTLTLALTFTFTLTFTPTLTFTHFCIVHHTSCTPNLSSLKHECDKDGDVILVANR